MYDKAIGDCDAALRLDPRSVTALILRASIRSERKEYDGAIADYNEVIRHDPMVFPAYLGRAAAQGEKGEYDAAITGLDQLIRIEPRIARHVRGARGRLEAQEAVRQGDRRFDGSHPARPAKHRSLPRPSVALGELKQFDKAIADYSQVIRLEPAGGILLLQPCLRIQSRQELRESDRRLHRGHSPRPQRL